MKKIYLVVLLLGMTLLSFGQNVDEGNHEEESVELKRDLPDEMPEFPGGFDKLAEYIQKNLEYPIMARESGIQGRVFVGFIVESDGTITHVEVVRGIGGSCDEEAVRVIQCMPKWNPAKKDGKPVRCQFTVPIVFKLTGDSDADALKKQQLKV